MHGKRAEPIPRFSALSTIIAPALDARGLTFSEIHHDAGKMVTAAASAHELYGWHSATLPTDLVVEAEALGAPVDFRGDMPEPMWPLVAEPLWNNPDEVQIPRGEFIRRGRIPLILDALRELKARVGNESVVGAWIPGPFTLAVQVVDYNALLPAVKHSPREVAHALDAFTDVLIEVGRAYQNAGADFITLHEMGGSPGVLGPRAFGELILPRLQKITGALAAPKILSVCGNTNNAMELLKDAGAEAVNVDQTNHLAHSREILGKRVLLFGNLDPVGVIARGAPEMIRREIERVTAAGVDAIMPGCDLFLETPEENFRALAGD